MIDAQLFKLIQAIQLLAADYETQLSHFPEFVHVPDELALTYSDCLLLVDQLALARLNSPQQVKHNVANGYANNMSMAHNGHVKIDLLAKLNKLDRILDKMSETQELWTIAALKKAPQWQQIRLLARELLSLFSQKLEEPDLSWVQYTESAAPSTTHNPEFSMPNLQLIVS